MKGNKRNPVLNVALHLWRGYRFSILGFWIVLFAIYFIISVVLRTNGIEVNMNNAADIEGSWHGYSTAPKVYLLVIGILLTLASLSSFVANGVTRRHFFQGSSLLLLFFSLISAILITAGYPMEQLVYHLMDDDSKLSHPPLFQTAFEFFLLFFAYFGVGWLIGTGFYRFYWWIGIINCCLALVPIVLLEMTIAGTMQPFYKWALALLLTALPVFVTYAFLRRTAIRRKMVS